MKASACSPPAVVIPSPPPSSNSTVPFPKGFLQQLNAYLTSNFGVIIDCLYPVKCYKNPAVISTSVVPYTTNEGYEQEFEVTFHMNDHVLIVPRPFCVPTEFGGMAYFPTTEMVGMLVRSS